MATRIEISEIMAVIAEEHPKFAESANPELKLDLWASAFKTVPVEIVNFAVYRMLAESPYTPKLADVVNRVKEVLATGQNDALDAWGLLTKAAERASIVTPNEFVKLPYEVQRFCGGLSGLRDLGMMKPAEFQSVTRGQFMKAYEGLRRSKETLELMSPELLALVSVAVKPAPQRLIETSDVPVYKTEQLPKPAVVEELPPLTESEWEKRRDEMLRKLRIKTGVE